MFAACYPQHIEKTSSYRFEKISLNEKKRGHTVFSSLGKPNVQFIDRVNEQHFIRILKDSVI